MKNFTCFAHQQNAQLGKKLRELSFNLASIHDLFVEDAQRASNPDTSLALNGLVTFSRQAFNELVSEIQMIERKPYTKPAAAYRGSRWRGLRHFNEKAGSLPADNSHRVMQHCSSLEEKIIEAYQHLLTDNEKCARVKSLLEHQLNGFRYELARLQLLKAVQS